MIEEFSTEMLNDLLIATDNRMRLLRTLPKENKYLFIIEKINIVDKWKPFAKSLRKRINPAKPHTHVPEKDIYTLSFYIDFMAEFFEAHGDAERDQKYLDAITHFFTTYPAIERNSESLFLKAFTPQC